MSTPSTTGLPPGRYGPGPRLGRRARVALVVALGVVAVAVATWIGLASGSRPVTWEDVGFTLGDEEVEVVFAIHRPDPSVPVRCTVQALDERFGQVGVVEVDVPATEERDVRVSATVRVTSPAVTGVVDRCDTV